MLAHEQLLDIAISNSNISDRGLSSLNHGISHLSLVGNTHLSRKAVYSAIVQSHRLFTLALGDNYLSKELELVLDKPPNLSGLEIYPDDDRIEIDGDISINRRIGLTMIGYRFSFLSNPSLQKSLSTARFLSIVKCRLVSSDLAALSKSPSPEWILIRSCAISKREVLEFGKWLVDHEVVADQPFSSNCNATELNTFFIWSLPQWRVRIDDTTTIESGDPQGGLSPAEMHD